MLLRFINSDGHQIEYELGADLVTIGRSPDAVLVIQGEKISRLHCGIRPWDQDYVLKDYGSTNGTYVNERRVDATVIRAGDVIRIGSVQMRVDVKATRGAKTILRELTQEMETGGKGYRTMLREIVRSTEPPAETPPVADPSRGQPEPPKAD